MRINTFLIQVCVKAFLSVKSAKPKTGQSIFLHLYQPMKIGSNCPGGKE
jgi:hypothetical protein